MSRPAGLQAPGQDEHACRRGGEGPFQDDPVRPDSNKSADIHAKYGGDGSSGSGNKFSYNQGGRGHLAVFYTSPLSFLKSIFLFVGLQLWGLLLNFDWFVHQVKCLNVLTTNYNLQKG